ncbi:hypothetical protein PBI_JOHANN_12 [Microbacterium phage Johann]|uniref:Uncharacterized protein n=2 Tax=Goodmanvirus goodman TaxID=2734238 RepID=A0A3G3M055_9CAUD|nr:hypothetical protein HOU56_gp12 [Microbacterium phage Goodman]AYQ99468.1 hypothetical protein PBI_GOODMAN_12 [Microbacterium phage Goodman]AYQ99636.1 hypothetical protein PBI_JOHANN_12 [Microbacterium phage Johann]
MGIGMMRRHYANDPESARVVIEPTGIPEGTEGGVVAIGDEPGTAPTPSVADAESRDLTVDPETGEEPTPEEIEGQGEAPEANEEAASEDQNGDPETTTDPVEHPPVPEVIEENLTADPTTDDAGASLGGAETAPEAPSRGASTATWQDFYTTQLGQDPGDRSRDQLANDYLGAKPE